jgi:nitroreductase
MDVVDAIKNRRSVRSFKPDKIPKAEILALLELANRAPSAGNLQARDFVVVTSNDLKNKLASAALGQYFIAEAPVAIVVCANMERISPYGTRGKTLYCIQDASAAVQNILLAAYAKGFATCWVGAFNEREVSKLLNLPEYIRPVAIIPVGYAAEKPVPPPYINIKDLVHYEKW